MTRDAKLVYSTSTPPVSKPEEPTRTYGLCQACGSVEVELNKTVGTVDLSYMGENPDYPTGYGCEVCS